MTTSNPQNEAVKNRPSEFDDVERPSHKLRYIVVQIFSRGGDLLLNNFLVYAFGYWYIYASLIAAVWNLTIGYFGQKYFVCNQRGRHKRQGNLKELIHYAAIRGWYGLIALGILSVLYQIGGLQYYWLSTLLISLGNWYFSYKPTMYSFSGSYQKLPLPIQKITKISLLIFITPFTWSWQRATAILSSIQSQ